MSNDPKAENSPMPPPGRSLNKPKSREDRGILIFTYPKIIFMFPTLIVSIICAIGMWVSGDHTEINAATTPEKPILSTPAGKAAPNAKVVPAPATAPAAGVKHPFLLAQNMFGLLFLMTLFFNLVIVAIDFPRFTVVGLALFGTTGLFFLLWLGMYFNWLTALADMLDSIYIAANGAFYLLAAVLLSAVYGIIFTTRWLDYWEILPNEILHHHGPWSDLERFPTMNLKFDKEIPDIFEHFMFGAGRLVLRLPTEQKAIVLDNVLHVSKKEHALKGLMSRLEVRVTTDNEVAQ